MDGAVFHLAHVYSLKIPFSPIRSFLLLALVGLIAHGARAAGETQTPATPPPVKVTIHYLGKAYDEPPPLSLVDPILTDNGIQGARLAIQDNNKSGQFLGQHYDLVEDILPADGDVVAKAKDILKSGPAIIIADLEAKDLLEALRRQRAHQRHDRHRRREPQGGEICAGRAASLGCCRR